jgi:hypothetical protein
MAVTLFGGGNQYGERDSVGGAVPTVVASTGAETAAGYGISEALIIMFPELKQVYDYFVAGNTNAALTALYKTNYYKNLSSTVKSRVKLKTEQPGVYADSLDKFRIATKKRLISSGIRLDDATFASLTQQAWDGGLDENQFDQMVISSGKFGKIGGTTQDAVANMRAYADAFGVYSLLGQAYWDQKSQDLFSGNTTVEDIQAEIKDLAASTYPAYADGFARGQSLKSQASNIFSSVSTLLEKDANTLSADDPIIKRILGYTDPKTGQPMKMPQWMVEKTIKSTDEWGYTNNARDTIDSLSLKVMRDWGLM